MGFIIVIAVIVVVVGAASAIVRGIAKERGEEYGIKLRE